MFEIQYPAVFWSIALVPHLFFLLSVHRFCQRREIPPAPWVGASFLFPFIAIPSLFAREQPEERQQKVFWRLFITAIILEAIFVFVAKMVVSA